MIDDLHVTPPSKTLFTLAGTPVQASSSFPLSPLSVFGVCWILVSRRYPDQPRRTRLFISLLWTLSFVMAYFTHNAGHIFSARNVGAPMDALVLNAGFWLDVYHDNDVSPQQHIGRAAGGPLANLVVGLVVFLLRVVTPSGPYARDLLEIFGIFNAVIGSVAMLPSPMFDGGCLLKWSCYEQTGDLEEAEIAVRESGLGVGVLLTISATVLSVMRRWVVAFGLAMAGVLAILDSLRRE